MSKPSGSCYFQLALGHPDGPYVWEIVGTVQSTQVLSFTPSGHDILINPDDSVIVTATHYRSKYYDTGWVRLERGSVMQVNLKNCLKWEDVVVVGTVDEELPSGYEFAKK